MMTSSNGNIFRVTGLLCGEFTGPGEFPSHKGQWRGALMFSLICARTNRWVNNREAGDLRRHQAHYDVKVMCEVLSIQPSWVQHPRGKSCRHITDVIMGTIASQITSLASVYSTVYSAAGQRNYQSSASLAFGRGIEFPSQRASNAENVSIWWRHHATGPTCTNFKPTLDSDQQMSEYNNDWSAILCLCPWNKSIELFHPTKNRYDFNFLRIF